MYILSLFDEQVCETCECCKNFEKCKEQNINLVLCNKDCGDDVWCYHDCKICADDFHDDYDNCYKEENSDIVSDNNDFFDNDLPF